MANAQTIQAMKAWCLENYEKGADTMVECWGTEDYASLLDEAPSEAEAWETLKRVAAVYEDRQSNDRIEAQM